LISAVVAPHDSPNCAYGSDRLIPSAFVK
jgi:hypothetical protein